MDPLSDILSSLDLTGMLYFSTEFTPPWGVAVPEFENVVRFHLVVRGQCHIGVDPSQGADLDEGDFALIPHGAAHRLARDRTSRLATLDEVVTESGFDGSGTLVWGMQDGGAPTRLICGHFTLDHLAPGQALIDALPTLMVARRSDSSASAWLSATLALLAEERSMDRPGATAIIRRLTEVLFIQTLRQWLDATDTPPGLARALADPRLSRALAAIHRDPATEWTVAALADLAGMSRSVFAERFVSATGSTPLGYVSDWRLSAARTLLRDPALSLDAVAADVGYASASAFSRAFARRFGEAPGQMRRRLSAS